MHTRDEMPGELAINTRRMPHANGEHNNHKDQEGTMTVEEMAHDGREMSMDTLEISHTNSDHSNHDGRNTHSGHGMMMASMSRKLKVAIVLMIPLLLVSPIAGFTLLTFPGSGLLQLLLGSAIFFYSGTPFFSGARAELADRRPAMMMLITMGIVVAYAYSIYATVLSLTGGMAMNFWFELSTLIIIMLIGHLIEMRAVMGAGDALGELAALVPKQAHLKSGGDIALSDLQMGDVLLVKENEKIPADGRLTAGTALVDESMITGESRAVKKQQGDAVYGGSLNQNQPFEMAVTTVGADSFLAQITELVRTAQAQKSKLENMADRVAGYLFYAALAVGLLALLIWSLIAGFTFALLLAVSVFVIACPHALGLAVPLVVSRLTSISAKNGLLIQNRTALEGIRKIKYALMDKTGTLTDGKFAVRELAAFEGGGVTETGLLQRMAALEAGSTHPIAQSIVAASGDIELQAEQVESLPGVGIRGVITGRKYQLVSLEGLKALGLALEDTRVERALQRGLTVSILLEDTQPLGFIALGDSPKADSVEFIKGLKQQGITPVVLTGDNAATATKIAQSLGISEFRAELKPEDKATIVHDYQQKGGVLFIGDGVNDAPALATADLSFAIGAGTSVAIHSADVVLVNSSPSDVLDMIGIARRMLRKMKQNLWFGAGYNIIAIPLAAGILYPSLGLMIDPLVAAVLMSLSTVLVAVNAIQLRYSKNR